LLVHLESETSYDSGMGERLLEYHQKVRKEVRVQTRCTLRCFPSREGHSTQAIATSVGHTTTAVVSHTRISLSHSGDEASDTRRFSGNGDEWQLLPLLPLTEGGAKQNIVRGMLHDWNSKTASCSKSASVWLCGACPRMTRKELKKEYHMIYDELRADPLYREMLDD